MTRSTGPEQDVLQFKRRSQLFVAEPVVDVGLRDGSDRKITRWRRIGERSGRRAGGGWVDVNAVGRHARSGGSRTCGEGGWMDCFIIVVQRKRVVSEECA